MQTVWKYLEDLVGKGLELSVIAEFLFYFAIHLIPMALPLAILLSSIMVFGNLAERYELVAIKSAGVSLLKAMRPMFVISIILAVSAFYSANSLIPKANLSWGALLYDVTQKKPAMNIVDNVFFRDIEGYAIRVGKKHEDNQTIEDIVIYVDDTRKPGNNNILIAKKGKMIISEDKQFMTLNLEDGRRYQELVNDPNYKKSMPHNTMAFKTYNLNIDLTELAFSRTEKDRFSEDHRMMDVENLSIRIDSLTRYIKKKENSLYKYLTPYFHKPKDTIQTTDTGIQARLNYLLNKGTVKLASPKDSIVQDTNSSKLLAAVSNPAIKPVLKEDKKKKSINSKSEVERREQMLEKALANSSITVFVSF